MKNQESRIKNQETNANCLTARATRYLWRQNTHTDIVIITTIIVIVSLGSLDSPVLILSLLLTLDLGSATAATITAFAAITTANITTIIRAVLEVKRVDRIVLTGPTTTCLLRTFSPSP
jgi:hypothetical protein